MRKAPRPGDRVIVPFDPGEVEAEVVYVSTIFDPIQVAVELYLDKYDDEPFRAMYPIDMIRPAPVPSA